MTIKALLVGINTYKDSPLKGCVNDVVITRDILKLKYAVLPQDIRMVVDKRATRDSILERLEWLISQSNSNDNLFFQYSGHGAQVPNRDYTIDAEPDGMDEVMCPVDFDWVKNIWISDDDINSIISKKNKNCRLVMVFDCCHSGTVYRDVMNSSDIIYESKARSIDTPVDLLSRTSHFNASSVVHTEGHGERFWGFDDAAKPVLKPTAVPKSALFVPNTIILSACADFQTAADANFKSRYQGAFSYCLQKFLYQNPDMSIRDLETSTVRYLKSFGFSQNPEFSVSGGVNARRLIMN